MSVEPVGVPPARVIRKAPITPPEVEWELERLGTEYEETVERYETAIIDAAHKRADFKIAHAKAIMRSKGTVLERNAWADYSCEEQMRLYEVADAVAKALRERMTMLHANLEKTRSLNTNIRNQAGLSSAPPSR